MDEQLFISSGLLKKHGFVGIFSLRTGGISQAPFDSLNLGLDLGDSEDNVRKNMDILIHAAKLDGPPHQARQVHGTASLLCKGDGYVHQEDADILIGEKPGCAVGVRTADCLPILLADSQSGMIAAAHAGWRGTALCVAKAAIRNMRSLGAQPENILACLGPCIGECCFEVDEITASHLADCCPDAEKHIRTDGTFHADLAAINRLQFIQCGISPDHIENIKACTRCREKKFFSYRRDNGNTGRHLAIVASGPTP